MNNGLTVPGIPRIHSHQRFPSFSVTGYQQIGPPAGANSRFATNVDRVHGYVVAGYAERHYQFGADIRREALDVLQPANPAGAYTFNTTGTNKSWLATAETRSRRSSWDK